MPIPDLVRYIEAIRAQAPDPDWKPKIPEQNYPDRRLKVCAAPAMDGEEGISVHEARADMRDVMSDYMESVDPRSMLLIRPSPGTGKTQAAVEMVDRLIAAGHRVGYAGPRHDFFLDVIAKSSSPENWYEWLPRQAGSDDKKETCRYPVQIQTWLNKGYEAMDFCSGVCGWDYIKVCPYHAQKARREAAIYIQHQHITMGHPLEFTAVIGDESPLGAFMRNWEIPARWVQPPGMDAADPVTEIVNRLADVVYRTTRPVSGPELYAAFGGPEEVIAALQGFEIPIDALGESTIHVPEDAANAAYFHLPALASLMLRECKAIESDGDCIHRVIAAPGELHLLIRRKVNEKLPNHVIWLDATGDALIYAELFNRTVRVYDARPEIKGKVFQVVDRANGKGAIKPKKKEKEETGDELHAKQAKTLIGRIIKDRGYTSPAVISFKGLEFDGMDFGHFYASRGTNAHEDADSLFVLGTPQPPIFHVVEMAKMIFFDRDRPFDTTWYAKDQAYPFKDAEGLGRCYPVSNFWNDSDLRRVLSVFREDEILQNAHRSRPVNHSTDIWLLTNIPVWSLPPDELLTMREIIGAPDGVNIWKWEKVKKLIDESDVITIADLVEVGLHYETASEYLAIITGLPGWEAGAVRSKHGKPARVAVKNE